MLPQLLAMPESGVTHSVGRLVRRWMWRWAGGDAEQLKRWLRVGVLRSARG